MPQVIEVPGMGDVEFPDDMSDDQISAAIQKNMQPARTLEAPKVNASPAASPMRGKGYMDAEVIRRGGFNPVTGFGEAALQAGTGLASSIGGGVAGLGGLITNPQANADNMGDLIRGVQERRTYQPRTPSGQEVSGVLASPKNPLNWPGVAGEYLGDKSADAGLPPWLSTSFRMAPEVGSVLLGGGVKRVGEMPSVPKQVPESIPTTAQIREASSAAYKAADDAGVVIAPQSTSKVVGMFKEVADAENLGKLPPKLKEASDVLRERSEANQPLTLKDADKVRQLINDAKASTDAADRRLAKIVQTKYDDYINNLKPEDTLAGDAPTAVGALKDARDLYRRQKNSELVDSIEKRSLNTGETNYTQAGQEAALRREFLRIVNNEKKARLFTPEQQAAMRTVAAPGRGANMLRNFGKVNPANGGMGAALNTGIGGTTGAILGGLIGGPMGAGAGALVGQAALGTGAYLAQRGALKGTLGRVDKAREALVGRGLPTARNSRGARTSSTVMKELRDLDGDLARLPKSEPFDSPRRQALERRAELLRAELLILGSTVASQR